MHQRRAPTRSPNATLEMAPQACQSRSPAQVLVDERSRGGSEAEGAILDTTDEEEAVAVGGVKEEGPDELMEVEGELEDADADADAEPEDNEERRVEVPAAVPDAA